MAMIAKFWFFPTAPALLLFGLQLKLSRRDVKWNDDDLRFRMMWSHE
jgi:hypothetical protein